MAKQSGVVEPITPSITPENFLTFVPIKLWFEAISIKDDRLHLNFNRLEIVDIYLAKVAGLCVGLLSNSLKMFLKLLMQAPAGSELRRKLIRRTSYSLRGVRHAVLEGVHSVLEKSHSLQFSFDKYAGAKAAYRVWLPPVMKSLIAKTINAFRYEEVNMNFDDFALACDESSEMLSELIEALSVQAICIDENLTKMQY